MGTFVYGLNKYLCLNEYAFTVHTVTQTGSFLDVYFAYHRQMQKRKVGVSLITDLCCAALIVTSVIRGSII